MIKEYDRLVCPECGTSLILKGESPLGRYIANWRKNAEDVFALIRPPIYQDELANYRLFSLYEDCYFNLLIGKYNAAIVLMGVLLEAIMKERIHLKTGKDFRGSYGNCLKAIEERKLMQARDVWFLKKFKNEIRNSYQHSDESRILRDVFIPVWPLQFEGGITLKKLESALQSIKSGELKPKILPVADEPAFRSIVKVEFDRIHAIDLFNQVYDFLLDSKIKYFKKEDYDEHFSKFGTRLDKIVSYEI